MSAVDGANIPIEIVQAAPDINPSQIIVEFLETVDPQYVQDVALERMGWGDDGLLAVKMLEVMKELARGALS